MFCENPSIIQKGRPMFMPYNTDFMAYFRDMFFGSMGVGPGGGCQNRFAEKSVKNWYSGESPAELWSSLGIECVRVWFVSGERANEYSSPRFS